MKLSGFSREVLLEKMRQILPEKRLTHCLGGGLRRLRVTAKRYGADEEQEKRRTKKT